MSGLAFPIHEHAFAQVGSQSSLFVVTPEDAERKRQQVLNECRIRCLACGIEENEFERLHGKKLYSCGKCHKRLYCSRECQKLDWPFHKKWTCSGSLLSQKKTTEKTCCICERDMFENENCCHFDECKKKFCSDCFTNSILVCYDRYTYPKNYNERMKYAYTFYCPMKKFGAPFCSKKCVSHFRTKHWPRFQSLDD